MTRSKALEALGTIVALSLVVCGCGSTVPTGPTLRDDLAQDDALPDEAPPLGKLPDGVSPSHYALALQIDPSGDRFSGTTEIRVTLDDARRRILAARARPRRFAGDRHARRRSFD